MKYRAHGGMKLKSSMTSLSARTRLSILPSQHFNNAPSLVPYTQLKRLTSKLGSPHCTCRGVELRIRPADEAHACRLGPYSAFPALVRVLRVRVISISLCRRVHGQPLHIRESIREESARLGQLRGAPHKEANHRPSITSSIGDVVVRVGRYTLVDPRMVIATCVRT